MTRHLNTFWLAGLAALMCFAMGACEKRCAPGFGLVGNTCRPVVPSAGTGDSTGNDAGTDSSASEDRKSSRTDSVSEGGGGAGGASAPAGSAAGAAGEVSKSSNAQQAGAQATSAGSAGAPATPSMTEPENAASTPAGPCVGRSGGAICDGAVLNHCDGAGNVVTTETCMSDALCQIGSASEICGQCAPGTFLCEGVQLKECSRTGEWTDREQCASEALCKDSAGACTEMVCMPEATTCDASGNLLTCNADGSDFADREPCGVGLCDAKGGRCNRCMPGVKTCRGNSLVTCSADGQAESDETCAPRNECWTAACAGDSCRETPKGASSRCEGSKYCNGSGECVDCTTDTHCSSMDDDCNEGTCRSGTCQRTPRQRGSTCRSGSGLCDRGTCHDVECFSASDCSGSGARCTDGQCVSCGDRKVGPGEECDIGAPKKPGELLRTALYDEYSCDDQTCKRLYVFTPCTVDTMNAGSAECGGDRCINGQICVSNRGCDGPGSCTLANGRAGSCYGNACFLSCNTSADCPSGSTCGEPVEIGRICS